MKRVCVDPERNVVKTHGKPIDEKYWVYSTVKIWDQEGALHEMCIKHGFNTEKLDCECLETILNDAVEDFNRSMAAKPLLDDFNLLKDDISDDTYTKIQDELTVRKNKTARSILLGTICRLGWMTEDEFRGGAENV